MVLSRRKLLLAAGVLGVPQAVHGSASAAPTTVSTVEPAAARTGALAVSEPGFVYFDEFFAGSSDGEKFAAMNTWHQRNTGAGSRKAVMFAPRSYTAPAIQLWAGMSLVSARSTPPREYSTGTVFQCQAPEQLVYTGVSNGGYGYPSGGAPRDVFIQGIMFNGGSTKSWLQPNPSVEQSKVLWSSTFRDCGWTNWRTIMDGGFDNVTLDGVSHVQGCYDTAFTLRGSECSIFSDGFSVVDASAAYPIVAAGKPFINCQLSKSKIGRVMVTSRRTGTALLISGGHNTVIDGFCADAQGSDPTFGAAVRVTGGDGIVFKGCSFKGMATNPGAALGGAASNRGWVQVDGGSQVVFDGSAWRREGNNVPATGYPLIFVGPGVGKGQVKLGLNAYSGFAGQAAVVQQSAPDQVTRVPDPSCNLVTAA